MLNVQTIAHSFVLIRPLSVLGLDDLGPDRIVRVWRRLQVPYAGRYSRAGGALRRGGPCGQAHDDARRGRAGRL